MKNPFKNIRLNLPPPVKKFKNRKKEWINKNYNEEEEEYYDWEKDEKEKPKKFRKNKD